MVSLPPHNPKIVATIGPASSSPPVLEQMIRAGMNIASLNFSHGDFDTHRNVILAIRAAAKAADEPVAAEKAADEPVATDHRTNSRMEIINL